MQATANLITLTTKYSIHSHAFTTPASPPRINPSPYPKPLHVHAPRRHYPEQETEERSEPRVHHHGDGVTVEG